MQKRIITNIFNKWFYLIWEKVTSLISNIKVYVLSYLKGVKIGKNTKFIGFAKFNRKEGSKIIVGCNCTFRSNKYSNFIGINRPCIISTQKKDAEIIIGNYCGFSGTVIGAFLKVELQDRVRCGANTLITDSDWHTDDPLTSPDKPVLIEENVWLGEGVKVLKGVNIGKNSVIGAGSVVTKSIPANVVAAGNPCKVIKQMPTE